MEVTREMIDQFCRETANEHMEIEVVRIIKEAGSVEEAIRKENEKK
jgi:hypothetical protein